MDVAELINRFNDTTPLVLPELKKLRDLAVGQEYIVLEMKRIYNKFGLALVMWIQDEVLNTQYHVYMPATYINRFNDYELHMLSKRPQKLKLFYGGQINEGNYILQLNM